MNIMDDFVDLWGQTPPAYNKKKLQDKFYEWHASGWRVSELRRQIDNRLDRLDKDNTCLNKSERKAELTHWSNLLQREMEIMHANFWDTDFEIRTPMARDKPFARMLGVEFPPSSSFVVCSTKNNTNNNNQTVGKFCPKSKPPDQTNQNGPRKQNCSDSGQHCTLNSSVPTSSTDGQHLTKKKRLTQLQQELHNLYKTEESIRLARDATLAEKPINYKLRWEKWEQLWQVQDKRSKVWQECETILLSFLKD